MVISWGGGRAYERSMGKERSWCNVEMPVPVQCEWITKGGSGPGLNLQIHRNQRFVGHARDSKTFSKCSKVLLKDLKHKNDVIQFSPFKNTLTMVGRTDRSLASVEMRRPSGGKWARWNKW